MGKKIEVAVFYFPQWHVDEKNVKAHGWEWTEWESLKNATPRFEGHRQPITPLWGYEDEADPIVMNRKINVAAENNIDCFIFDWYWNEGGQFLQRALEDGFLKAVDHHKLKFSVMWCNHDLGQHKGEISEVTFIKATDHMIENYFNHPSYWRINGGLYFSVYQIMTLINGFGGIQETARILNEFRSRVRKANLGELHINAVGYGLKMPSPDESISDISKLIKALQIDSVTDYVWIHNHIMPDFPVTEYTLLSELAKKDLEIFTDKYTVPYFPNVTMGWDSSPRCNQKIKYELGTYPYMPVLVGNTPAKFEKALMQTKEFLDKGSPDARYLTINSWNEWTEGSYIEPDTVNGFGYLEAIRRVFS
jgi:hypothetical protein